MNIDKYLRSTRRQSSINASVAMDCHLEDPAALLLEFFTTKDRYVQACVCH